MKKQKHISIRIEEDTLSKFHYVAKYDDRSASGQIMFLINRSIRDFEEKHGSIDLTKNESSNSFCQGVLSNFSKSLCAGHLQYRLRYLRQFQRADL